MEFKELSFEQTQIRIIDGDRGKNYPKKSDLRQRGHTLFLNNKNIINNYLDDSFGEYISEEKSNLLRKGKLERGDLVISTRGSIGNVGYYSSDIRTENIRINSGMLIIRNFDNSIDTEYLYVLMRSNFMKQRYKERISGSVQNQLPIRDFKKIKIPIPDLHSQIIIKNVILTLDSKIEINNKIISNLESQAQAIFKSWFVDFEPFQDGDFVESELGMIPEGWEVKELGEIINLYDNKRVPISKMDRDKMEKNYPYYGANGIIDYVDNYLFDGKYLLMGEDGTVRTEEGFPILNYVDEKFWVSNHAHIMRGTLVSTEYIYLLLSKMFINNIVTGAVQEKINQRNLKKIKIIFPEKKELESFEKIIEPMFKMKLYLNNQNIKLAELRDALLPKLMAGEIDVSNIKIEGEEVKNE